MASGVLVCDFGSHDEKSGQMGCDITGMVDLVLEKLPDVMFFRPVFE